MKETMAILYLSMFISVLSPQSSSLISEFMCPCKDNCGKALEVCECGDADGYIKEIESMQSAGLSSEAIRDAFVAKYGQTVLAAPSAKGFGLVAYVAPVAVLVLGVGVVVAFVRRRRKPAAAERISAADIKKAEEMVDKWKSSTD